MVHPFLKDGGNAVDDVDSKNAGNEIFTLFLVDFDGHFKLWGGVGSVRDIRLYGLN